MKRYRKEKIDFLQYQVQSYKMIEETVDYLAKMEHATLSKTYRRAYVDLLTQQWADHDPLIILDGEAGFGSTSYAKLKRIVEFLAKQ